MALTRRKKAISTALSARVRADFRIAEDANAQNHRRCLDCLRQIRGELFPADASDTTVADVSMNITAPIVRGLQAMLGDVLNPITSQPFTLISSPIPDLPEEIRQDLLSAVQAHMPELVDMAGGDEGRFRSILSEMVQTTLQHYKEQAAKAAERLTHEVADELIEGGFENEFMDWVYNYIAYPVAIMKGPIREIRPVKRWQGTYAAVSAEPVRVVRNMSPFDVFPSPHARDLQTCEFIIERMRVNASQLLDMVMLPGYDLDAIDALLKDTPQWILPYAVGGDDTPPDSDSSGDELTKNTGYYDILIRYGRIRGADLVEYEIEVEDERRFYEAEIWVIGEYVIRAVLNPDPMGRRPFVSASFMPTPGEVFGSNPVEMVRDAQCQCTMAGRALTRNMEFASGPMGEVDSHKLLNKKDDPSELYPLMIREVKRTVASPGPAYTFYSVPSLAGELMAVYNRFAEVAYELLGIPRIAFGQMQGASTIGRTSGGVAMVMNQAAKPIKQAMVLAERAVIEPVIQRFVDHELMYNPDPLVKGDVNVQANGVRGLTEREQEEGKLEWALQSIAPFITSGLLSPEVALRILSELFKRMGIDIAGLPNFDMMDAVSSDLSLMGGGEAAPEPGQQTLQVLDGRSQVAMDTIDNMNGGV